MPTAVSPGYLEKIKTRLHVSTARLNGEITDYVLAARADMVRLGVSDTVASDETDPLVLAAVRAYALWQYSSDTDDADRSHRDYRELLDALRKNVARREAEDE